MCVTALNGSGVEAIEHRAANHSRPRRSSSVALPTTDQRAALVGARLTYNGDDGSRRHGRQTTADGPFVQAAQSSHRHVVPPPPSASWRLERKSALLNDVERRERLRSSISPRYFGCQLARARLHREPTSPANSNSLWSSVGRNPASPHNPARLASGEFGLSRAHNDTLRSQRLRLLHHPRPKAENQCGENDEFEGEGGG